VRGVGLENDGCNTVGNDLRICETSINLESTEAGFAKSKPSRRFCPRERQGAIRDIKASHGDARRHCK
jgi:hypothetical protein